MCGSGVRTEYQGYIMANHYTHFKGEFVCVDEARQYTNNSQSTNNMGNLWYTTEFERGSLPGDVFKHDHEATCAQCTVVKANAQHKKATKDVRRHKIKKVKSVPTP